MMSPLVIHSGRAGLRRPVREAARARPGGPEGRPLPGRRAAVDGAGGHLRGGQPHQRHPAAHGAGRRRARTLQGPRIVSSWFKVA